jgi:hypothetical protein
MADVTGESIATTLRLSKALGLARQGKLREAQQLFAAEGTLPENSLELHALAALATGEGDYTRAQRLWRLLLHREPGHAEAKRMIDSIELWLSRPAFFQFIPAGLVAVGLGLVIAFIVWAMGGDAPPPRASSPRPAVSTNGVTPQSASPPSIVLPNVQPTDQRRRQPR